MIVSVSLAHAQIQVGGSGLEKCEGEVQLIVRGFPAVDPSESGNVS